MLGDPDGQQDTTGDKPNGRCHAESRRDLDHEPSGQDETRSHGNEQPKEGQCSADLRVTVLSHAPMVAGIGCLFEVQAHAGMRSVEPMSGLPEWDRKPRGLSLPACASLPDVTERPDAAASIGKRIAFWAMVVMASFGCLATLFWALDFFVVQSASTDRSSRFLGLFGVQTIFWGLVLFAFGAGARLSRRVHSHAGLLTA